ncbi:unnamed protein product [Bubo scandiacus]
MSPAQAKLAGSICNGSIVQHRLGLIFTQTKLTLIFTQAELQQLLLTPRDRSPLENQAYCI